MPSVPNIPTVQQATGGLPRQFPGSPQDMTRSMAATGQAVVENVLPGASDAAAARDSYVLGQQIGPALREGRYGDAIRAFVESTVAAIGAAPMMPSLKGVAAGMFGGPRAANADLGKLERARKMTEAGSDPKTVWKETGWFQGRDGQWRFEIDDSEAALTKAGRKESTSNNLGKVMHHKGLYQAYPDTRHMDVALTRRGAEPSGQYQPPQDRSHLGLKDLTEQIDVNGPQRRSTLLHEAQHAVQRREGFARGGSPEQFPASTFDSAHLTLKQIDDWRRIQPYMDEARGHPAKARELYLARNPQGPAAPSEHYITILSDRYRGVPLETLERAREGAAHLASAGTPHEAYRRLAGETEARLVERRANLTPEQRRESFPLDQQDVPASDQIVWMPAKPAAQRAAEGMTQLADPAAWIRDR